MARTGRYEKEVPFEAGVRTNRPRVERKIFRMPILMTAASCSPAIASRHAKYDDDFLVPTLLGAQPLEHTASASPTLRAQYRHASRTYRGREATARAHDTVFPPSARQDTRYILIKTYFDIYTIVRSIRYPHL